MKKLLTTVVVVLFAFGAYAQLGAGIKAGVNFANQSFKSSLDVNSESKTGYHFGAFFTLNMSDNVALQPEILFSKQGSELTFNSATSEVDYSYLTIPVLLKYNLLGVFNLHVGPQFNILSSAKIEDTANNAVTDIKEDLKSLDFSVALGAGLNLPMGLTGGLRYVIGVSDINDGAYGTDTEVKNKLFQIYLGYRLFGE